MEQKKKEERPAGLHDPDRAAYMIAWRDRHIEKQKELIKGMEEELTLLEALLAFALFQKASEKDGARVLHIPKSEVRDMLAAHECEVTDGEEAFLVSFRPRTVSQDGEEQGAP